jgi:hypothetical protein
MIDQERCCAKCYSRHAVLDKRSGQDFFLSSVPEEGVITSSYRHKGAKDR